MRPPHIQPSVRVWQTTDFKIYYVVDCDCHEKALRIPDFKPVFLGAEQEKIAAKRHLDSNAALARDPENAPRYWAYHVGGRHVISVK